MRSRWVSVGVDDYGDVLQQRWRIGHIPIPTCDHRLVSMPEGNVVEEMTIP